MKQKIVIFGAGTLGKSAYQYYKESHEICFFADNNEDLVGTEIDGVKIILGSNIAEIYPSINKVIVASYFKEEIINQLYSAGIDAIEIYSVNIESNVSKNMFKTINLGGFLFGNTSELKSLTFMYGTSTVLDYAFLINIANRISAKNYLEIGTFVGESIYNIADYVEHCFSVSLPDDEPIMTTMFRNIGKNNFSRFLANKKSNITLFKEDSKVFDFKKIDVDIDLVFIDGDHSLNGVKLDTENIFSIINVESTIVVWHDFKNNDGRYNLDVVNAIKLALKEELLANVFSVDFNMCGIYIPNKYLNKFSLELNPDELYTYDVVLNASKNMR